MPLRRVRKAYEQISDQLRELIIQGEISVGQRLPNETVLAQQFGVSRATVREALRVLAAQDLIKTLKGVGGGSYVTSPSVDHISNFLHANLKLLTDAHDVSLGEFLEARESLEVPASRLAALRRTDDQLALLEDVVEMELNEIRVDEQFQRNRAFHALVLEASRNTLLSVSAQPIFSVLQTNLARSTFGRAFHENINAQHRDILDAVRRQDAEHAAELMQSHLMFIKPHYERAWRHRPAPLHRTDEHDGLPTPPG